MLVRDTQTIEVLIERLSRYLQAKDEADECFHACDTSPGYFCRYFTQAAEKCAEEFGSALTEFIDGRIKEFLNTNTLLTKGS